MISLSACIQMFHITLGVILALAMVSARVEREARLIEPEEGVEVVRSDWEPGLEKR
jgi:hypothetical protein